ncbi:MAG TPA: class IV adenylate cyclase [Tepidisphaeraceae bacterium]|nr:class IV adenylate cyclase [Tepidisphaeraceae bacterium]
METELEAKVAVDDLESVRGKLRTLQAKRSGRRLELNIYFDTADRSLLAADKGLRIRSMQSLDTPAAATATVVTFKGPQAAGSDLKSREEIEFSVESADRAAALLAQLGFHAELGFEKRRESWHLAGCEVELDELPRLGTFVEVEGASSSSVKAVLQLLGLGEHPLITESYIAMMSRRIAGSACDEPIVRF